MKKILITGIAGFIGFHVAERLLARLIDTYLASAAKLIAEGDEALAADDGARLRRAAHTLKSSSANLGAAELARRCAAVEQMAREQRLVEARGEWPAVVAEFQRVKRALRELGKEPAAVH